MTIPYGERSEISKNDVLLIIKEAENHGIKLTSEISKIRSWRDGKFDDKRHNKYISIEFEPHIISEFYNVSFILDCDTRTKNRWNCDKRESIYIRFDLDKGKDILAFRNSNPDINILVEVARAANNLRPMSWYRPISSVHTINAENYRVTFGTNGDCTKHILIRREYGENDSLYAVNWDKTDISSCSQIAGYFDTSKLYMIYENGNWVTD